MWDDFERLLVDCLKDYDAGMHTCGRHLSESLKVEGQEPPDYVVGKQICLACKELDATRAAAAKANAELHKQGRHPEEYTLLTVWTRAEAVAKAREQGTLEDGKDDD